MFPSLPRTSRGLCGFLPRQPLPPDLILHNEKRLQSLPEPHVIAEGAIQPVMREKRHPADALFLVVSQCGLHFRLGEIVLELCGILERFDELNAFVELLGELFS